MLVKVSKAGHSTWGLEELEYRKKAKGLGRNTNNPKRRRYLSISIPRKTRIAGHRRVKKTEAKRGQKKRSKQLVKNCKSWV